jgi:hypothetical protein
MYVEQVIVKEVDEGTCTKCRKHIILTIQYTIMSDNDQQKPKVWKHIGLYGHAVGTFTGEKKGVHI